MRKGDLLWILTIASVSGLLLASPTRQGIVALTAAHPYVIGFLKFFVLATMGELLALRIVAGRWAAPQGLVFRALIWGFLGMAIVLVFEVFGAGVSSALAKGLLPGGAGKLAFAFFVSAVMNVTFAPTMMLCHRVTDTYIDLRCERAGARAGMPEIIARIDWGGFVSFVLLKTIPFFWIPAHTVTFLLPPEYRILAAAFLSIALGGILAFAKRKAVKAKVEP
jgi:hypothetical protein